MTQHFIITETGLLESEDEEPRLSVRSLSSPDFMKSYKPSFDAERDWPPIDLDEDEDIMLSGMVSNKKSIVTIFVNKQLFKYVIYSLILKFLFFKENIIQNSVWLHY